MKVLTLPAVGTLRLSVARVGLLTATGELNLEFAVPVSVEGRNYPAGAVFGIGFHRRS